MIVYGSSLSPFVRKVLVYAAEKGVALDVKPAGLGRGGPEFEAASPFRKIPAFSDGDFLLADSSAIVHYLEAKYPEPVMIPAEAKARGKTVWFDEFADTILMACGTKMFFNRIVVPRFLKQDGDLAVAAKAEKEELPPILAYLEHTLLESGYLIGNALTLADIAIASPFVNLAHCGVTVDGATYPRLRRYLDAMHARPSFSALIDAENAMLAPAT